MSNEELIIKQHYGMPIRSRIYVTAGIILGGIGILWAISNLPWAAEYLLEPISLGTAWISAFILQLCNEPVFNDGLYLRNNFVYLEITPVLTGIYQIIILNVGIFAWSGTVRRSWRGILLGSSILVCINLVRIISIYYSVSIIPDWRPFFQGIFWEGVMVLYVPLFWMYWASRNLKAM